MSPTLVEYACTIQVLPHWIPASPGRALPNLGIVPEGDIHPLPLHPGWVIRMSFRVLLYFVYKFLSRQTPSGILRRGPPRPEVIQVINFSARYHCRLPSGSNNRRPFSIFYLVVHSITTRSLSPSNMVSVKRSEDGVLIVTDSGWHMRIEVKVD